MGRLAEVLAAARAASVEKIMVVTFRQLANALSEGVTSADLDQWRAEGRTIAFTYYGDCGYDARWAKFDGYVTMGDPWPDPDGTAAHADAYEIDIDEERIRRVRTTLTQAHGAALGLTRKGVASWHLHVGAIAPYGWHEENTVVECLPRGRKPNHAAMGRAEFEACLASAGGIGALSERCGISEGALRRYRRGERAIGPAEAAKMRMAPETKDRGAADRNAPS
jgi:hypothetical protein